MSWRYIQEGAFIYPYMTNNCRFWPWRPFLPHHQLILSCTPRRCKSSSQQQSFHNQKGQHLLPSENHEGIWDKPKDLSPFVHHTDQFFHFLFNYLLRRYVTQHIGLTKKFKVLQIPDSSSVKAKGPGSTEVLRAKMNPWAGLVGPDWPKCPAWVAGGFVYFSREP